MNDDHVYRVLEKLDGVRRSGSGWKARCPAHHDPSPSLGINVADDGKILLRCYAGCDWRDVCEAAEIDPRDLFPPKESVVKQNGHGKRIAATYNYEDESGTLLFQVVRFDPKGFAQRKPGPEGEWVWSLGDVRRVLYRLPELLAAREDRWVFVVEGEKDADALWERGFVATTNVGGAGKRTDEYVETLKGRSVVVLPDNDEAGRKHAQALLEALTGVAREVRVVELPGLPEKADVSDWFASGGSRDRLTELVVEAGYQDIELPGPPPFPIDVLPPVVRRYVEECAQSVPVPPEMVAVPLLAMVGGLIGNRVSLRLKRGWQEYASLYSLVVAGPGTNKSAAIKHARWPLKALQKDAKIKYDMEYQRYLEAKADYKNTPVQDRGDEPRPPKLRHYFTTDVTMEALAGMLDVSPGICISSDELSGWVKRMNQYRQGGDREQYLSIWAAEPMKVDRKSGGSVYVETPVVSVFGGIQPDVVPTLHSEAQVRDGFVERLLPFLPTLPAKEWRRDDDVSTEAYSGVADLFRAIDQLPPVDTSHDERSGESGGIAIHLSTEANTIWGQWYNENNALARSLGGFLGGFYIKLEAHVARFALILHVLKHAQADVRIMVDGETMRDAIELGEFFRGQIGLFQPLLVGQGAQSSHKGAGLLSRIERLIRRKGWKTELLKPWNGQDDSVVEATCLSTSDLLAGLKVTKEAVLRALDTQADHTKCWVETIPTGNNPTQAFCIRADPPSTEEVCTSQGFSTSVIQPLPVPTPPSVHNGRWAEGRDPWD
jgi:hypothetical protein